MQSGSLVLSLVMYENKQFKTSPPLTQLFSAQSTFQGVSGKTTSVHALNVFQIFFIRFGFPSFVLNRLKCWTFKLTIIFKSLSCVPQENVELDQFFPLLIFSTFTQRVVFGIVLYFEQHHSDDRNGSVDFPLEKYCDDLLYSFSLNKVWKVLSSIR